MRRVLFLLCAFAGLGCQPPKLHKTLPPGVRVDTYDQQSAAKVDVLWVVDNSGSMGPRQQNLAKNFHSFIDLFTQGSIDFRIAVTTTDIFKDQGQLQGSPKVITPQTGNVVSAFAANIAVGTKGSPYEAGLQAAQMALDRQAQTNQPKTDALTQCQEGCNTQRDTATCQQACLASAGFEFLRPDAYLYLVFVTDEEDRSGQDIRYYWRTFETAKGIGNDGTVTTAAIIGDVPSNGCGATPGARYVALSKLTGGEVGSICDVSFAATLKKLATNAVGLRRKFALEHAPNVETLQVTVKYACNSPDEVFAACGSVNKEACQGAAAGAVEASCTPVQGGPDGWSYEAGSQVVFFAGDSVPGVHSSVELQYYEEGVNP